MFFLRNHRHNALFSNNKMVPGDFPFILLEAENAEERTTDRDIMFRKNPIFQENFVKSQR